MDSLAPITKWTLSTYQQSLHPAALLTFFPCRASDIVDLKLIDKQSNAQQERSVITIAKPIAKRAGRTQSTSDGNTLNKSTASNGSHLHNKSKPIDIEPKITNNFPHNLSEPSSYKNNTPNKRDKSKGKWSKGRKDEECFGSPLDDRINKDFDFEKNLALFDKQAMWEELNSHKPDVIKHAENRKPTKYK